jgi:hypothetical protein
MKTKLLPLIWAFLLLGSSISSKSQSVYLMGSATTSIEPENSLFSVALAGYGAPRDGRFSISWKYVKEAPQVTDITGFDGKLYAINKNHELLVMDPDQVPKVWKQAGEIADGLITGLDNKLYFLNKNGVLKVAKISTKGIKWKKVGKQRGIIAWTGLNDKLYAVNENNRLLTGKSRQTWQEVGEAENIVSMAGNDNRIYAVDKSNILWYTKPYLKDNKWIEIGRYNKFTYNIGVKEIAVSNDRLYAVADDGKLYIAEHSTKGDLSARALAIQNGNQTVVIVGLDVTGFNASLVNEIKDSVFKRRHIPPAAILINASHTHFAPVTQAWLTWGDFYHLPDSNYLNKVKTSVIKTIESALDHLSPAKISFARGATHIGINRRDADNPNAPHDTTLDVLTIQNENNGEKIILFSTACHAVFRNAGAESFTLSANYPGVARELLKEKAGAANSIFINGCSGDINPKDNSNEKTGTELANDVISLITGNMQSVAGPISYSLDSIQIPSKPWTIAQINQWKTDNISAKADVFAEKNVRWADLMLDYYKKGVMPATMPIYVQTINIGNWKLVGLSREAVNEYGTAIRNLWPGKMVTVAGYCNDVSSYLPRDWHIRLKTYEGYDSFFWYGQPSVFPETIFDTILDTIRTRNH